MLLDVTGIWYKYIHLKFCRSAREAEALEKKARESGEILPTEKRFDSNCITPGKKLGIDAILKAQWYWKK